MVDWWIGGSGEWWVVSGAEEKFHLVLFQLHVDQLMYVPESGGGAGGGDEVGGGEAVVVVAAVAMAVVMTGA